MSATRETTLGTRLMRFAGYCCAWPRYRRLVAIDFLPQDRIAALQAKKLQRLLRHARATVPYYRDLFDHLKMKWDGRPPFEILKELPLLTKAQIAANFPDRMLSHGRRDFASEYLTSTGTTADRIDIVVSPAAQLSRLAIVFWRHHIGGCCPLDARRIEIPPDACSRVCGTDQSRPPGLFSEIRWGAAQGVNLLKAALDTISRRLRRSVRHGLIYDETLAPFGPEGTRLEPEALQAYVNAIDREKPYLVTGLPTYLHEIARHIQRTGQTLHVPVVHPMGSLSTAGLRQLIVDAFGAEVFDIYGASELGTVACECEVHQWLHVAMGSYIVEILRDGRPAAEGELGHIAITGLDNYAMPLIRYELGDVGRWRSGPCRCGRTTQLMECNGRIQDLIMTAQGKAVTEEDVMDLAYFRLRLEHFQLVERKRGEFDLMVVAKPGQNLDIETIRTAARDLLDNPRRLDVFPVNTINREATGKFRFVKSASYEDFR